MRFKPLVLHLIRRRSPNVETLFPLFNPFMASQTQPLCSQTLPADGDKSSNDDVLCSAENTVPLSELEAVSLGRPNGYLTGEVRIEMAWAHWNKLGRPKLIVAPMVDNSELPFRMLCRKYGAQAAYTPMLHARIFSENEKYRSQEFTTCKEDRPLFVQFCANDPDILLEAARRVEPFCDYVDINLGCPQRIARRGNYGAFLMDNLPLVKSLVEKLAHNLNVPVSCKIRIFPNLEDTIKYAKMLEDAGCSLLAVHGRTRDEKDGKKFRASWQAIKAVRDALKIPVLANGNVRHLADAYQCLEETGCEGVLSAESLLENPALFAGFRTGEWVSGEGFKNGDLDLADLAVEYLRFCEVYSVPWRMVRSHVHKMLGEWFRVCPEVRDELNSQSKLTFEFLYELVEKLRGLGVRIPLCVKDSGSEWVDCHVASAKYASDTEIGKRPLEISQDSVWDDVDRICSEEEEPDLSLARVAICCFLSPVAGDRNRRDGEGRLSGLKQPEKQSCHDLTFFLTAIVYEINLKWFEKVFARRFNMGKKTGLNLPPAGKSHASVEKDEDD
ncbi:tRNA-dihydrouridine synthase [Striga asiatica]|uniref:tRNA-dihydrouridine(16/17) synthase [NAD(P)(+)] n=1 Tax=Striga asiatica TaxID=4170 RepID=A0A5A7NX90_STRAF|nr:tRNA-dihydrouridine synthase [Striga asiatica]